MSPVLIIGVTGSEAILGGGVTGHIHILIKSFIVLSSWLLGYFGLKHLPLTIAGPINAARPVIVLVGALLIFGEHLNWLQWIGILLGFWSLFFYKPSRKQGGLFVQTQQMAVVQHRRHVYGRGERSLRQMAA